MRSDPLKLAGRTLFIRPDSAALPALRQTAACLRRDDLAGALRWIDRAWRVAPEHAAAVGAVYGALLLRQGRDFAAALAVLRRSVQLDPRPDTEALLARALLGLNRPDDAARRIANALAHYAVTPRSPLREAARAVLDARAGDPGWAGLSPRLEIVGELGPSASSRHVQVSTEDGRTLASCIVPASAERGAFSLRCPAGTPEPIRILADGAALLGSGQRLPPEYRLDGRSALDRGVLGGWIRLGWAPDANVAARVEDAAGRRVALATFPDESGLSRRGFRLALARTPLRGDRFTVSVRLPRGRWRPLADAPLLTAPYVKRSTPRAGPRRSPTALPPRAVDVVIPVYLGLDETVACIESVLAARSRPRDILVVDDASPDAQLAARLDKYARTGRITLLRNERNLGFPAAVNRALAVHPDRDAVVLNSDTVVHHDWLARLRIAAYRAPDIGTATPFTNDGSIASHWRYAARECSAAESAALDGVASRANKGLTVDLPVGVGFCMYLRRDCLAETGPLDEAVFGRGYGEEVDFCLRASRRGWRHVLAADTFVLHSGGRSFGARRAALQERSQRLLQIRHPRFKALVEDFDARDPVRIARRRIAEAQLERAQRRFVLLVSLALRGGVERYVKERAGLLRRQGHSVLLLQPSGGPATGVTLTPDLDGVAPLVFTREEIAPLASLLRRLDILHSEIHHFIGLQPRVIESVRSLDAPYDVHIHDYVWMCPRITLIDASSKYCGEPALAACERCVARNGNALDESITVAALRRRSAKWLGGARRVVAPAPDVAQRLARYFPDVPVDVRALQREPARRHPAQPAGTRIRVALLGAIGTHKGYDVLLACARDAKKRRLPLDFTVIGFSQDDAPLLATGRVFVSGSYADVEAAHLLRRENPHVILLPSVWPETWSYTLTHALESGLPIVAFDLGAIAGRLRAAGVGTLLPLDTSPSALNDHLVEAAMREWPFALSGVASSMRPQAL